MAALLLVFLLWFPGALLRRRWGVAPGLWGTGGFAVEATLSLAFLCVVFFPLYILSAPLVWIWPTVSVAVLALAVFSLRRPQMALGQTDSSTEVLAKEHCDDVARVCGLRLSALEGVAFVVALAVLVPTTLTHAGANVDDWWDLSFVSGWIADGRFRFEPMALAWSPASNGGSPHPRFLWSTWLMLQTALSWGTGEAAWRLQAGALAAVSMTLAVSAQAALARALFRDHRHVRLLVPATIALTASWFWGTEALPLFVRGYQDKLFAAFVLAPVLLAFLVRAALPDVSGVASSVSSRQRRGQGAAVAAAALATVSVHSLIYTMTLFVGGLAVLAIHGAGLWAWVRSHRGVVVWLGIAALYPLGQALSLKLVFGDQGISLATRDNPVVRAHLALNRLVADHSAWWIVDPVAVFGPVALVGVLGLAVAWRCRRHDAAARMVLALTLGPVVVMFVPGVAGVAGRLWVPWMLYRVGWLVPVAALLSYTLVSLWTWRGADDADDAGAKQSRIWSRGLSAVAVVVVLVVAGQGASDRLRRGMNEHPGQAGGAPQGSAAMVYEFLGRQAGRDGVLAPPNFSELVPGLSGKPVVAFPERGTLVLSGDEEVAYARMRDRAQFFASASTSAERDAVAARYGARWAVLPRRLVSRDGEAAWLRRFGASALLAARAADEEPSSLCEGGACRTWWSATAQSAREGLGRGWSIALETPDYLVAEHEGAWPAKAAPSGSGSSGSGSAGSGSAELVPAESVPAVSSRAGRWSRPFHLDQVTTAEPSVQVPPESSKNNDVELASITGSPGAQVEYSLPPRFVVPEVLPVWTDGPRAWEDAPTEVSITMDIGATCAPSSVRVVPHLPHDRRDVFDIRVENQRLRAVARHETPILLALDDHKPRRRLTVHVSSLLGNPVSLGDVALLGNPRDCTGEWPVRRHSETVGLAATPTQELGLTAQFPSSARALMSLGQRAMKAGDSLRAADLFAEATRREPSLVEAWIELGFAREELAEESDVLGRAARETEARDAFAGALRADSNSAWAHGCVAWAARRAGLKTSAVWHAWRAASLDPHYADAWTIFAYVLADLHLHSLSEWALELAEQRDRARNWPALARADLAMERGDVETARGALRAWIRKHPFDDMARSKLSEVAAYEAKQQANEGSAASESP